jgi:putative PIN family toxin of toxin-antitoxin system
MPAAILRRAVLDATILASAFLRQGGVSDALLGYVYERRFSLYLADDILAETDRILLETERIRRYAYPDDSVRRFIHGLRSIANLIDPLPPLTGMVRDPNDDMMIACASAASAAYLVTRDKDLLSL